MEHQPIRIHPGNRKLFEFRGQPRVLLCATEHYGAVMNRPFRFERYLADAAAKAQTLTRLFTLFREFQSAQNPYSTCKPESTDYITPFPRTGPGLANDWLPKFDLAKWNPEFFDRLHRFISLAAEHGVVVEVVLFSNTYADQNWSVNPLNASNNVNDVETIHWADYTSCRHPKLFRWQCDHARKIVTELNRYDNVIYEICNEPGGNVNRDLPSVSDVNEWQSAIARLIRETEAKLPNQHLIAGQQAFSYTHTQPRNDAVHQAADSTFGEFPVDIANLHPLPNMTFAGKNYDLGQFMSGELHLDQLRQYCLDTYAQPKPLNLDEDNCASRFRDIFGWTIHRKRAWTTLHCGAHYDVIDFSIQPYLETGTDDSQKHLRTWMKYLSEYFHTLDLVSAKPLPDTIAGKPAACVASAFGVPGRQYSVYIADAREGGTGERLTGELVLRLPPGRYEGRYFHPRTGLYDAPFAITGADRALIPLQPFEHDIALQIERQI